MNPRTFQRDSRRITPLESVPGKATGWRLAFNVMGVPWLEPAMASVKQCQEADRECIAVHGVLHKLSPDDWRTLVKSEGGNRVYKDIEIDVTAYDGRTIRAHTFAVRSHFEIAEQAPSKRYLALIYEGACHHGIDTSYLDFLRNHPYTVPPPLAMRTLIYPIVVPVIAIWMLVPALQPCAVSIFHGLWWSHDRLYPARTQSGL